MEYCEENLRNFNNTEHDLQNRVNYHLKLFLPLCLVVKFLHDNKIVHRDLKPTNILLKKITGEEGYIVKIADFGISKFLDTQTHLSTKPGNPAYMAPEIHRNENYSFPCDIFSLGVIFYQMITGNLDSKLEKIFG